MAQANSFDRRQTLDGGGGGDSSLSEVQGLMSLATKVANDIANGNATSACSNWVSALQVCYRRRLRSSDTGRLIRDSAC